MRLKIHHIDAFTETLFTGNYAAVIITEEWLPDQLMQSIATENNLSETAFARRCGSNSYEIRWFSPLTEIDFCGHATLAAAFVLFNQDRSIDELLFSAKAVGHLKVRRAAEGYIEMTFPMRKPEPITHIPRELTKGLSIPPTEVLLSQQAYFVIYPHEKDVLAVRVVRDELMKLAPLDVVVTAQAKKYDFISRYFWPANGSDEDPVTGSIHAGLAPLWAQKLGKKRLTAYQASQRGGILRCMVLDSQVIISGQAVQYLEGYIDV
ncbi:MAG: PhzF family phenazine biosynthesis protein [Proteobacteria bacterium]|nr:PhzF family phenazine biosynthesis protein [Pseudomonadota bacterium]MBU1059599.1 PhzF family phenazine biosynthesis protein [Pseudomonadota bacterium]